MTPPDEGTKVEARVGRRRWRPRGLSVLVFVVVAAAAGAGSVGIGRVVDDQESRLLQQRAREAGSLLGNATSQVQTSLGSLGAPVGLAGADPDRLAPLLEPLVEGGQFRAVAIADPAGSMVVAAAGEGFAPGDRLRGPPAVAIARADAAAVSTGVFRVEGETRLGFAVRPAAAGGLAVYAEAAINPDERVPVTSGAPFSDLTVALYASELPDADQLVLSTTGDLPLRGDVVTEDLEVGGDRWVLVVKARSPLVGSVAESTPWVLFGGGLVLAVAMAAVVEVLGRRRAQVQALVEERTAALRRSLADLEDAQVRLVAQERLAAIGELAAGVGHELRNPLGVIANAHFLVRAALEAGTVGERSLHQLGIAEREVAQASLIVADLLDFARPRDPIRSPVAVAELVEEVLSVSPAPSGIRVTRHLPEDLPAIDADRDQLRQVILNLVSNAVEAMPDGGTLTVGARLVGDTVVLTVSDTGVGMDAAIRARVFEPFFTAKARGIGLGLAVTRRIVEAHAGSITVSSQPGGGTTFTVVLPMAVPAEVGSR